MEKKMKTIIQRIFRRKQKGQSYPNLHLPASTAKVIALPRGGKCYVREGLSDFARVSEYGSHIYAPKIKFTDAVRKLKPTLLVDVGANIGLSSLSLLEEFSSITKVFGLEAECENFNVLEKNYDLWTERFRQNAASKGGRSRIEFHPKWVLASADQGEIKCQALSYLPGGLSASGTFAPTAKIDKNSLNRDDLRPALDEVVISPKRLQVNQLLNKYSDAKDTIIVKIDIEGGEEELMSDNVEWLERTAFLTIEIHDRMGVPDSSRSLLQRLIEYDFAIVPEADILHCFNRKLLQL